ncbi:alanine--glyoxylate aminotransferase family protein [Methanomicrobium antiquum]|uniref:Alanine--glyoxylate aminotransferase family protein n=1 Tax=Methanomicrobium antiquum TaxID=487686 RepID=A0AAF0FUU0_9EURY|nr:alanine--glyoxylate aminotransferase family protein [Methanomicrobium antiquum]WFN36335.1 alanine--glyoxylate aminotransferase family protein [Methanomicrobium antiquum]
MQDETLLMMPGPVPMPQRVRMAMAKQAINHRGAEFGECFEDINRMLKPVFGTENDILVISGSGSAGMEAAVANFCAKKKVVSLVNGKFGDRLYKISKLYSDEATGLASEWGTPLDLEKLKEELENGAEAVTLVHNETSAAIKNPAEEIGKLCRKHDALFIMDGITSIGGDVVKADKWGADIAIVGSQKCLAAPAGLAAVSVSEKAWENIAEWRPLYLDLLAYKKSAQKSQTPYTPAVPLFFALREALRIVEEEGLENRIARHKNMADAVRAAAKAWGLELFPKLDKYHEYSNTATAICYPEGIEDSKFRGAINRMGIEISGGQDELKGKIFRIGTMGATGAPEVMAVLSAVQKTLKEQGKTPQSCGVMAAAEVLKV